MINNPSLKELVNDWGNYDFGNRKISVLDTTLRDGLQGAQIKKHPTLSEKIFFLHACEELGIDAIEIGFPISSEEHKNKIIALAKDAKNNNLKIKLSCMARTVVKDVEAVIDVSQKAGVPLTVNLLVGSSRLRRLVEDWDKKEIVKWIEQSIKTANKYNLPVEFLTEDTTRSHTTSLETFYTTALNNGVKRIWICDTVGIATPNSTKKITQYFIKHIIRDKKIGLDWHGHDDRGLSVANSLAAAEVGADRIQGTALGVGERAGNAPLEQVIINLALSGNKKYNLKKLLEYSTIASKMFGIPIRDNYPGIGNFVHSTAVGMHAAAILKARKMRRKDLEGIVYSPFHPEIFDRELEILVGPMSGVSNVIWNLEKLGIEVTDDLIEKILLVAKRENRFLKSFDLKKISKLKKFANNGHLHV